MGDTGGRGSEPRVASGDGNSDVWAASGGGVSTLAFVALDDGEGWWSRAFMFAFVAHFAAVADANVKGAGSARVAFSTVRGGDGRGVGGHLSDSGFGFHALGRWEEASCLKRRRRHRCLSVGYDFEYGGASGSLYFRTCVGAFLRRESAN